ncbi:hypothetical protein pdam_00014707, partial [Pocillopora damicornis]
MVKIRSKPNPSITPVIRQLMRTRDQWHKLASKTKDPLHWNGYKFFRQEVKREIRIAEKAYVRAQILESKGNSNSIWKIIHRCPLRKNQDGYMGFEDLTGLAKERTKRIFHFCCRYECPLKLKDAIMVFKFINNLAPDYLANKLRLRSCVHDWKTRSASTLDKPFCCLSTGQRSFAYRGAKLCNSLSSNLKQTRSASTLDIPFCCLSTVGLLIPEIEVCQAILCKEASLSCPVITRNHRRLKGFTFKTFHLASLISCGLLCQRDPRCVSTNFRKVFKREGTCELNDRGTCNDATNATMVFKCINNLAPDYPAKEFELRSCVHDRQTRSASTLENSTHFSRNTTMLSDMQMLLEASLSCPVITRNHRRLKGFTFKTFHLASLISCGLLCQRDPRCVSTNFRKVFKSEGACELNDRGVLLSEKGNELEYDEEAIYTQFYDTKVTRKVSIKDEEEALLSGIQGRFRSRQMQIKVFKSEGTCELNDRGVLLTGKGNELEYNEEAIYTQFYDTK